MRSRSAAWMPIAGVGDRDDELVADDLGPGQHGAAVRGELDGVREQVHHDLLEPQLVGLHRADSSLQSIDTLMSCDRGALAHERGRVLERAP